MIMLVKMVINAWSYPGRLSLCCIQVHELYGNNSCEKIRAVIAIVIISV